MSENKFPSKDQLESSPVKTSWNRRQAFEDNTKENFWHIKQLQLPIAPALPKVAVTHYEEL